MSLGDLPDELLLPVLLTLDIRSLELFCSTSSRYREGICQDQQLWKQLVLRDFSEFFSEEYLSEPQDNYKTQYYILLDEALQANHIIAEKRSYTFRNEYQAYCVSQGNLLALEHEEEELWKGRTPNQFFSLIIKFAPTPEVIDWGFDEVSNRPEVPLVLSNSLLLTADGNLVALKWLNDHGIS